MTRVLHIALSTDWAAAVSSGSYEISTRGLTLAEQGFIHCSAAGQVEGVHAGFYADLEPSQLVLLVVDAERCPSPLRWDEVPGSERPFPHFYGPITVDAVVAAIPFVTAAVPGFDGYDVTP
ncbi:DUF952 domain-containing protein [Kineosporia succinea]|uniref:Uncharacterized protein (DUF952 family) n=1 Tax=Kineosporia succinea TaxID=84632 RepID=A0ABT9P4D6_9ACTN|nr:DUF952 domain-containing protein [Kineosporia succinea]MDP9827547.1 uncharacterized protein (DUF952 family) [Kineosporia succinea]